MSQEFDPETGFYNYNARLYDPQIGRFLSADTIVPDAFNPQAFNRYSYNINNPLKYTDPTGHDYEGSSGSSSGYYDYGNYNWESSFSLILLIFCGLRFFFLHPQRRKTDMVNCFRRGIP